MRFSIIAALTNNNVIGKSNTIPWVFPRDMVWFRYHTLNKIVIMGCKTFKSIGNKPLSNRLNIVLSHKNMMNIKGIFDVIFVKTFWEALWIVKRICNNDSEIMIIGGGEIYRAFFCRVSRLYLTCIDINIQGDTFFPCYEKNEWRVVRNINGYCSYINCAYSFRIYDRF